MTRSLIPPHVGPDAVFGEFFPRLLSNFSEWVVKAEELLETGEFVVALGYYQGRVKETGVEVITPFTHVWKLSNGNIVQVRQYVDTVLMARALAGKTT